MMAVRERVAVVAAVAVLAVGACEAPATPEQATEAQVSTLHVEAKLLAPVSPLPYPALSWAPRAERGGGPGVERELDSLEAELAAELDRGLVLGESAAEPGEVERGQALGPPTSAELDPFQATDIAVAQLVLPPPADVERQLATLRRERRGVGPKEHAWVYAPRDRSGDPEASVSVGNVTTGYLLRGKPLAPQGPGWRVIEATRRRGYVEGGDVLVGLLVRVAGAVARLYPDSVLRVGNLSRPGGGDIEVSVSHNTGRDVDVGFYVADARGRALDAEGYVGFDADGRSEGGLGTVYFDSARNWALVRALLTDSAAQVQYIFVADWLKALLLDFAIRSGEHGELVARAERVLQQPENSSPHAEHFHVRVYCDLYDRLSGCHEIGPRHAWVQSFDDQVQARIDVLVDMYQSNVPEDRAYALAQLEVLTMVPAIEEGGDGVEE